jgi:hypothetical protein
MASMQEYFEKFSSSQLQALLREEAEGRGSMLPEVILAICDTLSRRDLSLPNVEDILRQLCRAYL